LKEATLLSSPTFRNDDRLIFYITYSRCIIPYDINYILEFSLSPYTYVANTYMYTCTVVRIKVDGILFTCLLVRGSLVGGKCAEWVNKAASFACSTSDVSFPRSFSAAAFVCPCLDPNTSSSDSPSLILRRDLVDI